MTLLAPEVIARRFQDLMDMGRARLPGLAPDWTDHNAHDPGITLMELLAWVTEAQLYSVGRTRRDERAAYAALLGLSPGGTEPARGLLWPDPLDPSAPVRICAQSVVIPAEAAVSLLDAESPPFRVEDRLLWVPGRVSRLTARQGRGGEVDYTVVNQRGGPAFQPFGADAGGDDVLRMAFECRGDGLFPPRRQDADGALWPIGVRADRPLATGAATTESRYSRAAARTGASLTATLVTSSARMPLRIAADSSHGLLRTGVLMLDLSAVTGSPREFVIELRATRGFERPPRLLRIEPNVLPIVQGRAVVEEIHDATGLPDWSFRLDVPGLRFAPSESPLRLVVDDGKSMEWSRRERLFNCGPDDLAFMLDTESDSITFGNGVNGRIPPRGARVRVSYAVSSGEQGDVTANRRWSVSGFAGTFGVNPDAIVGGRAPTQLLDERREARRRAREDHALVNAEDIIDAALRLPLLEVARAWVPTPRLNAPRTGIVTLVAMRARRSEEEAGSMPETSRWLGAIRRQLTPRMPLASRLLVTGPRYVGFSVRVRLEVANGQDPEAVKAAVRRELARRLALSGEDARDPGVPVSKRDLAAWIRAVDGVRSVSGVWLAAASGREIDEVKLPRNGLPRFDAAGSDIDVRRAGSGGVP
jgi:predicted phage baseplate assembly protein